MSMIFCKSSHTRHFVKHCLQISRLKSMIFWRKLSRFCPHVLLLFIILLKSICPIEFILFHACALYNFSFYNSSYMFDRRVNFPSSVLYIILFSFFSKKVVFVKCIYTLLQILTSLCFSLDAISGMQTHGPVKNIRHLSCFPFWHGLKSHSVSLRPHPQPVNTAFCCPGGSSNSLS